MALASARTARYRSIVYNACSEARPGLVSFVGAAVAPCGAAAIREGGAAKNAKCLGFLKERSRGVVYEPEEVSKDALPELQCREALHFALFWCLAKVKLRARELI